MESNVETRNLSTNLEAGIDTILFIFVGLLIGQIVKHICNKLKMPYSSFLTLIGIGVGFLSNYTTSWGQGAKILSSISPHTFFFALLPPLIFGSAFSVDWHIMKVEILQIFIMGVPFFLV